MENVNEGNKIIAEFMGYTTNYWYQNNQLTYHSNWGKLMPVVEKIEAMFHEGGFPYIVMISGSGAAIYVNKTNAGGRKYEGKERIANTFNNNYFNDFPEANVIPKVMGVWQAVVQFIQWYNANTQTK